MVLEEISNIRLERQRISGSEFSSPREIVSWMGAMQAQDFAMARWAVGLRLKNSTDSSVLESYNKGEILRTHVMRPTWHWVSADDIFWMLQLTSRQIKQHLKTRHRELEFSDDIITKSFQIIENTLSLKKYATREDLASKFKEAGIRTDENRMSYILLSAELEAIICSGPVTGKKITYALLSERVTRKKTLSREESLSELAKRYFRSHSPATIKDFSWWSGLSLKDARAGLESVKEDFHSETIGNEKYWFQTHAVKKEKFHPYLLPAYDEYLISYQDRSAALTKMGQKKIISINGIFRPVVLIDGQINGVWRKTAKSNLLNIEIELFHSFNDSERQKIANEASSIGNFFGMDAMVKFI